MCELTWYRRCRVVPASVQSTSGQSVLSYLDDLPCLWEGQQITHDERTSRFSHATTRLDQYCQRAGDVYYVLAALPYQMTSELLRKYHYFAHTHAKILVCIIFGLFFRDSAISRQTRIDAFANNRRRRLARNHGSSSVPWSPSVFSYCIPRGFGGIKVEKSLLEFGNNNDARGALSKTEIYSSSAKWNSPCASAA